MAWLYQRNQIWWIGTRSNGRQILKSTGTKDEAEAKRKLALLETMEAAKRADRLNKEFFEMLTETRVERVRLHESLESWVERTTNPNTRRNYQVAADRLRAALPDNPNLRDVTHQSLQDWVGDLQKTLATGTVQLIFRCVKAFFAEHQHALVKNPCEGVKLPRKAPDDVKRTAFSRDQIRRIMTHASPFWRIASAIGFYTGLRLGNVATLRVKNVDLDHGRIQIERTVKTGARVDVAIPPGLVALLRKAIPAKAKPDDFIFPEQAAMAERTVSLLSGQFADLLVDAGIRKPVKATKGRARYELSFHSWRHSFVSLLASAGVNQQTAKALVGHSSETVNDHYTHLDTATTDTAVEKLPDILGE